MYIIFQIILAVMAAWLVSGIFTVAGAFPDEPGDKSYKARADAYVGALKSASWFFVPYPCRKHST